MAHDTCETRQQWLEAVSRFEDTSIKSGLWSITQRPKISGSRLTRADYLSLRVLWSSRAAPAALRKSGLFTKQQLADADTRLASFPAYQTWMKHLRAHRDNMYKLVDENNSFLVVHGYIKTLLDLGTEEPDINEKTAVIIHSTPLKYRTRSGHEAYEAMKADQLSAQLESLKLSGEPSSSVRSDKRAGRAPGGFETPGRASSSGSQSSSQYQPKSINSHQSSVPPDAYPQTHGEYVTNCALLLFLQTLTWGDPKVTANWSVDRASFHIEGVFTALTDGLLAGSDHTPTAIIECKAYVRKKGKAKIRYQESAQMAGYLHNMPSKGSGDLRDALSRKDGKRRRFSIAQNHCEIYIIVAEFTDRYMDFLLRSHEKGWEKSAKDRAIEDECFMVQRTYGPYLINEPSQLNEFAAMVVTLSRMQCA